MSHDDHFHCFDHAGAAPLQVRSDTYRRGKPGSPNISFYSLKKDLNALAARSKGLLTVSSLGKTPGPFGGRDILMARIGKDFKKTKPKAILTAGLHAREWIGPSYVYLVAEWLLDNPTHFIAQKILEEHHVIVVPMVNPDGHEYSVTTDRMFRKNSPPGDNDFQTHPTGKMLGRQVGAPESVDLNRNFPSPNRAAVVASKRGFFSTDPDVDEFIGAGEAFETQALKKLIATENPDVFVDHHAFGCFCLHSPGDDVRPLASIDPKAASRYAVFTKEITNLLDQGALRNITTRPKTPDVWTSSQASDFYRQLYAKLKLPALAPQDSLVPGGIDDFAFYQPRPGGLARAVAYTLELPPMSADKKVGFELPESAIRPVFRMCLGATLAFISTRRDAVSQPGAVRCVRVGADQRDQVAEGTARHDARNDDAAVPPRWFKVTPASNATTSGRCRGERFRPRATRPSSKAGAATSTSDHLDHTARASPAPRGANGKRTHRPRDGQARLR
ncbi:MAG: M14 family zinc carboxypeptidase [Polyangiaceae bacterium]